MRLWTWLEAALLPLAAALMLASWVAGGLRVISLNAYGGQTILSLPAIAALWLAALYLTRWALTVVANRVMGQVVIVAAGLVAVVVALGGRVPLALGDGRGNLALPVVAGVVGLWLWWRGIVAGRAPLSHERVYGSFVIGIAAWVVILALGYLFQRERMGDFASLLVLFFLSGLFALALASLATARRREREQRGLALAVNRYWLALTAGIIGVIILLGLLVAAIVTPDVVAALFRLLDPLATLLWNALFLFLVATAWLIFPILEPIAHWLRDRTGAPDRPLQPTQLTDFQRQLTEWAQGLSSLPEWVAPAVRFGALLAALVGVLLLFALAFRRFTKTSHEEMAEEREFIGSWDLLKAQLAAMLARLRPAATAPPGPRFLPLDGEPGRRAIREVYQTLLGAASDAGYRRPAGQTPSEYLATLRVWAPAADEPLAALTQAYVEARYGTTPIDATQVERAQQAWREVQAATARVGARGAPEPEG